MAMYVCHYLYPSMSNYPLSLKMSNKSIISFSAEQVTALKEMQFYLKSPDLGDVIRKGIALLTVYNEISKAGNKLAVVDSNLKVINTLRFT